MTESIEDLKMMVQASLEKTGVLPRLRAELRKHVFVTIEGTHKDKLYNEKLQTIQSTPFEKSALELVKEFLYFYELDYTNSVLEAEASVARGVNKQLADSLGITKRNSNAPRPVLVDLVELFLSGGSGRSRSGSENSVATENSPPVPGWKSEKDKTAKASDSDTSPLQQGRPLAVKGAATSLGTTFLLEEPEIVASLPVLRNQDDLVSRTIEKMPKSPTKQETSPTKPPAKKENENLKSAKLAKKDDSLDDSADVEEEVEIVVDESYEQSFEFEKEKTADEKKAQPEKATKPTPSVASSSLSPKAFTNEKTVAPESVKTTSNASPAPTSPNGTRDAEKPVVEKLAAEKPAAAPAALSTLKPTSTLGPLSTLPALGTIGSKLGSLAPLSSLGSNIKPPVDLKPASAPAPAEETDREANKKDEKKTSPKKKKKNHKKKSSSKAVKDDYDDDFALSNDSISEISFGGTDSDGGLSISFEEKGATSNKKQDIKQDQFKKAAEEKKAREEAEKQAKERAEKQAREQAEKLAAEINAKKLAEEKKRAEEEKKKAEEEKKKAEEKKAAEAKKAVKPAAKKGKTEDDNFLDDYGDSFSVDEEVEISFENDDNDDIAAGSDNEIIGTVATKEKGGKGKSPAPSPGASGTFSPDASPGHSFDKGFDYIESVDEEF